MSQPLVSVCLPVFNGDEFLAESIESVLTQTFTDFELLIADDRSTDSSFEICQQYAQRDPRVVLWRNQTRLGLFANYNECMRRAKGSLIKPFAQDDLLHAEFLSKAVPILQKHQNVTLLNVGRTWIDENGVDISATVRTPRTESFLIPDCPIPGSLVIRKSLFPVTNFIGEPVAVLFRASSVDKGFDESMAHIGDLEFWIRLLMQGAMYFEEEVLCSFRVHSNSQSSKNWKELTVVTDLLKLGRIHGSILAEMGISTNEFIETTITAMALSVKKLWESDRSTLPSTQTTGNDLTACEQALTAMLAEFKELSWHTLRMLGEMSNESEDIPSKNHKTIIALEERLTRLLSSPAWRYTKPLRDFNSRFKKDPELETLYSKIVDDDRAVSRQQTYIYYLRKSIALVRSSRSWAISKPIRVLFPTRH